MSRPSHEGIRIADSFSEVSYLAPASSKTHVRDSLESRHVRPDVNESYLPGVVAQACNASSCKAETGRLPQIQGQHGLLTETLSRNNNHLSVHIQICPLMIPWDMYFHFPM